jgi:hypothetical protein
MKKILTILFLLIAFFAKSQKITYTPMNNAGYRFYYFMSDSGQAVPFRNLSLGRGTTRPGSIVCNTVDSLLYYYNGVRFVLIGVNSSGTRVDSLTLKDSILCAWQNGTSVCTSLTDYSNKQDSNTLVKTVVGSDTLNTVLWWSKGVSHSLPPIYTHSGGGGTNNNIGSGFRLVVPSSNNIKTLFCNGCTLDSISNANALTVTVPPTDTALIKTLINDSMPNLQRVTDVGYTTTNPVVSSMLIAALGASGTQPEVDAGSNGNSVALAMNSTDQPYVRFNKPYSSLLKEDSVTSSRLWNLPDSSGILALSVNGIYAGKNGNIPIPVGGSGTVTQFNFTNSTGITGTVTNATTTPTLVLSIDTAAFSNFSVKVRSLFSATSPIHYVNGLIYADTGLVANSSLVTAYDLLKSRDSVQNNIPLQFNPIQGTNITLSGTYPNITFTSSGSGTGITNIYPTYPNYRINDSTFGFRYDSLQLPHGLEYANVDTTTWNDTTLVDRKYLFQQGFLKANQSITVTATGDATGTSTSSPTAPSLPLVLATVNSNVGSFTNANITVNGKGLITAAANGSSGSVLGTGTTQQVAWWRSSNTLSSNSNLFYDTANFRLGIFQGTPLTRLHIVDTTTAVPRGILIDQISTGTNGARETQRKARGTVASPTTIVTGDVLASWTASGYEGTNFIESGKILVTSKGTIATSKVPAFMDLQTANTNGALTTGIDIDTGQVITLPHYTNTNGLLFTNNLGVISQVPTPAHNGMHLNVVGGSLAFTDTVSQIPIDLTGVRNWDILIYDSLHSKFIRSMIIATSPLSYNAATTTFTLGTVPEILGGTNQTTYSSGDMLYASGTNTLSKLGIGTNGQTLHIVGGLPVWRDTAASGSSAQWTTISTNNMYSSLSGNVGIGISAIPLSKFQVRINNISAAPDSSQGILLDDTTTVSLGNQRKSPGIYFSNNAFKTNATVASQKWDFRIYQAGVEGPTISAARLRFGQQVLGGGFNDSLMTVSRNGVSMGKDSATAPLDVYNPTSSGAPILKLSSSGSGNTWLLQSFGTTAMALYPVGSASVTATNYALATVGTTLTSLNVASTGSVDMRVNDAAMVHATSAAVSIGSSTNAVASAMLQIMGTSKGFLPPFVTTGQKNAISSPNVGLQVYDSSLHKMNIYDGNWVQLSEALFTNSATKTVTNTTTETTLIGTGVGSLTLPANYLQVGKQLRVKFGGVYTAPITPGNFIINVKLGGTTIATGTASAILANASNASFSGEAKIVCITAGGSGTVVVEGGLDYSVGNNLARFTVDLNNAGATTTVNTFTADAIDVTATWDTAVSTKSITCTQVSIEAIN